MKLIYPFLLLQLALTTTTSYAQKLTATALTNPSGTGSLQQNWSGIANGGVVLSWIEPSKEGKYSLRYAIRRGTEWSQPRTVAANRHFFRHPAEAPRVIALNDHRWMAHWVEMPDESSEAEYLFVSSSSDGVRWSTPQMAHRDRGPGEHGLASMVWSGAAEASLLWLEMLKGEDGPAYLMRTVVDASGQELKEEQLDLDVCTCCPTSVAKTSGGLVVAYRDHTPQDIRDISVVRFERGRWTKPATLHPDNWHITACPVNAASVAATGDHVAIAWYTGAQESPRVQLVFSEDGGKTFGKLSLVSTGHSFGYTSVILNEDGSAIVSWLERGQTNMARLLVRSITASGVMTPVTEIATGRRQAIGYPRLVHSGSSTYIAWGKEGGNLQVASLK